MINRKTAFRLGAIAAAMLSLPACQTTTKMTDQAQAYANSSMSDTRVKLTSRENTYAAARDAAAFSAPQAKPEMPRPSGRKTDPRFDVDARDLPAASAVANILAGSGMTAILTEEAEASRVTITLRDVSWREALDALRVARGFDYQIDGRKVIVDKPKKLSQTFEVDYLALTRSGASSIGSQSSGGMGGAGANGSSGMAGTSGTSGTAGQAGANGSGMSGGSGSSGTSSLTSTSKEDFWAGIKSDVDSIVGSSDGDKVSVNPMAGTVFVRAGASKLREVEKYIKSIEGAAHRQVLIEARIVEVTLDDGHQTGVNWTAFNNKFSGGVLPATSNGTMTAGPLSFNPAAALGTALTTAATNSPLGLVAKLGNFTGMFSFLETQGTVHVVSSPRVATLNNRMAILKVGDDQTYATGVSSSSSTTNSVTGASTSSPTVTTQNFFSGVEFAVTPQVSADGMVTLDVRPKVTSVSQQMLEANVGTAGSVSIPTAKSSVQDTSTVIRIGDGDTAVIGGLMRVKGTTSRNGLPVAGCLAGQCQSGGSKAELVLLVKVTVIKNKSDWAAGTSSGFGE